MCLTSWKVRRYFICIDDTIAFTCFAVLRYLLVHRLVLHQDISKGNILYFPEETTPPPDAGSGGVLIESAETEGVPLCFIKYLLGERCVEINWD